MSRGKGKFSLKNLLVRTVFCPEQIKVMPLTAFAVICFAGDALAVLIVMCALRRDEVLAYADGFKKHIPHNHPPQVYITAQITPPHKSINNIQTTIINI